MTRIQTYLLLLLAFLVPTSLSQSLRTNKDHDEKRPRKEKLPPPTRAEPLLDIHMEVTPEQQDEQIPPIPGTLDFYAQHPRDLLDVQEIDEALIESRVVGGNTVTDYNKHPFFAEWHNQFCGGAVRQSSPVLDIVAACFYPNLTLLYVAFFAAVNTR